MYTWTIWKWNPPAQPEKFYTFPTGTKIQGNNNYTVVYLGTNNYINNSTALYLYDDSFAKVSSVSVGSVPWAYSYARWRMADSDEPYGDPNGGLWYNEDTPTPGSRNDPIPEFKDIAYHIVGTLFVYAIVRRRSPKRNEHRTAPSATT